MLGLPKSLRNKDSIMVVVGYFSKIMHLFHVAKHLMLLILMIYTSRRLLDFMTS